MKNEQNPNANTVKAIRLKLGLNKQDFAEQLGCDYSTARKYEHESSLPTVKAIRRNLLQLAEQAEIPLSF